MRIERSVEPPSDWDALCRDDPRATLFLHPRWMQALLRANPAYRPLYLLAESPRWYERRTSIVSTWFFIRRGDLDDTFRIAQILANDPHDLVQKEVGGWIREAGKRDEQRLRDFLDRNAATMPRTALRYAIEQLPSDVRDHYLGRKHR